MRVVLLKWCEYIFPKRKDYQRVRQLDVEQVLLHLCPTHGEDFVWLLSFNEPAIRALIHEAKFKQNEQAWKLLAAALSRYFNYCPKNTLVLPIPLYWKRRVKRGYNQVNEVLKLAIKEHGHLKMETKLLFRKRATKAQTSLDRHGRLENVADAFGVRRTQLLTNKHVIIIDDVATTGATLKAAKAAIEPHFPASITLLALAH